MCELHTIFGAGLLGPCLLGMVLEIQCFLGVLAPAGCSSSVQSLWSCCISQLAPPAWREGECGACWAGLPPAWHCLRACDLTSCHFLSCCWQENPRLSSPNTLKRSRCHCSPELAVTSAAGRWLGGTGTGWEVAVGFGSSPGGEVEAEQCHSPGDGQV